MLLLLNVCFIFQLYFTQPQFTQCATSFDALTSTGYRPRFVHTRPARSLSVEFEGHIYDVDLQADDQSAVRRRVITKRHHRGAVDQDFDPASDDGSEEMLADDTNAVGYPNSVKVTHK